MEDGVLSQPAPYTDFSAYFNPTTGNKDGIEVLMGSSQILYGPRTTGGVLNYLTTPIPSKRKNHTSDAIKLDHVPGAKGSLPILNTVPSHSAIEEFIL